LRLNRYMKVIKPKWRNLKLSFYLLNRNPLSKLSMIILLLIVLAAIFAPVLATHPEDAYLAVHPADSLLAPSSEHILGTDDMGRDIFSRILYGARISLVSALIVVFFSFLIGSTLGAVAGAIGGWIDEIIMRIADMFLSFPALLLAVFFSAMAGPSLTNAQIALVLSWWPWYTRYMRGQAISVKERPFVKAAEAIGTNKIKIIFRHIFPNCVSPLIVQAAMDAGGVILTLASLSFLGLGAQAPTPEWGLMINISKSYFLNAWWFGIFPGLAILVTVLSLNLLGEGLREILDPKTRKL
jgi:peptide/nickel transport system permease protein